MLSVFHVLSFFSPYSQLYEVSDYYLNFIDEET